MVLWLFDSAALGLEVRQNIMAEACGREKKDEERKEKKVGERERNKINK
jgi:hypothetical protein